MAQIRQCADLMLYIQPDDVLTPETFLPEQFERLWWVTRSVSPERTLVMAVLLQAAQDLRPHLRSAPQTRRLYRQAYEWVTSDDRSWPYSFLNVCDVLGLSPQAVREELLTVTRRAAA